MTKVFLVTDWIDRDGDGCIHHVFLDEAEAALYGDATLTDVETYEVGAEPDLMARLAGGWRRWAVRTTRTTCENAGRLDLVVDWQGEGFEMYRIGREDVQGVFYLGWSGWAQGADGAIATVEAMRDRLIAEGVWDQIEGQNARWWHESITLPEWAGQRKAVPQSWASKYEPTP